ncbi:MAG: hypothetical protein L3J52_00180 [Proteobacteria bacterium]|nr:hypothetical protein [Pseudomonadota bacterium]
MKKLDIFFLAKTRILKTLFIFFFLLGLTPLLAQNTYWVEKSGNDANNCTNNAADACLTIQKGVSLLNAGDTLNVGVGTYTDDGGASPYIPAGIIVGWLDNDASSSNVVVVVDGEPNNMITIQATPGSEGQVTIDGENLRMPIHMQSSDYIRISGFNLINSRGRAIASWGQTTNAVADPTRLSIGVVIENNKIIKTTGDFGTNVGAISMWGTQDWTVRNNYIDDVYEMDAGTNNFSRYASAIQAYGVITALIENNQISNVAHGIFWKDHYITDILTRGKVDESEIRYNKIEAQSRPVYIGIRGTDSVEAGNNYIHHNIFYGHGASEEGAVSVEMAGAFAQSGDVRIEHNLIDGENIIHSRGIKIDASRNISLRGNIIIRTKVNAEYTTWSSSVALGKKPVLNISDYNIYNTFNLIIAADNYGDGSQGFATLNPWQAALDAQFVSLNFDNPDINSITETPGILFDNLDDKNYTYKAGSPAIGMMPDGSNAGPYQLGNETIGLLPQWPGGNIDLIFGNGFE